MYYVLGNLDSPEGTLDSLMQVMVCSDGMLFIFIIFIINSTYFKKLVGVSIRTK